MKQAPSRESPFHPLQQAQELNNLPINFERDPSKNLYMNFEDMLTAQNLDRASPNLKNMKELLISPTTTTSKPISMWFLDQNSCIPFQENNLEISIPFEDLLSQIESPKLSNKMQMILSSNVNLSESIMKNTFRAVDDSRIRLEDKDLQVELEISELKLHHLDKKVEGCLNSSKNILALSAQLSQNMPKISSPSKQTQAIFSPNIKRRSSSKLNTPNGRIDEELSKGNSQSLVSKVSEKKKTTPLDAKRDNIKGKKTPGKGTISQEGTSSALYIPLEDKERKDAKEVISNSVKNNKEDQRGKAITPSKGVSKNSPISAEHPNSTPSKKLINEAYQKLQTLFVPNDNNKSEIDTSDKKVIKESNDFRTSLSAQLTGSNNMAFHTLPKEKEFEIAQQNKISGQMRAINSQNEDQNKNAPHKPSSIFSCKSKELDSFSIPTQEESKGRASREITLIGSDGKERIYILKPKETLSIQKLETISISFSSEDQQYSTNSNIFAYEKMNPNNSTSSVTPKAFPVNSTRTSNYENSNVASVNLDQYDKIKSNLMLGSNLNISKENQYEHKVEENIEKMSLSNLKLQNLIQFNGSKQLTGDSGYPMSARVGSTGLNSIDVTNKESKGPEIYFKRKIEEEFLNECEHILTRETSNSPSKRLLSFENTNKQIGSWNATESINDEPKRALSHKYRTSLDAQIVESALESKENENDLAQQEVSSSVQKTKSKKKKSSKKLLKEKQEKTPTDGEMNIPQQQQQQQQILSDNQLNQNTGSADLEKTETPSNKKPLKKKKTTDLTIPKESGEKSPHKVTKKSLSQKDKSLSTTDFQITNPKVQGSISTQGKAKQTNSSEKNQKLKSETESAVKPLVKANRVSIGK